MEIDKIQVPGPEQVGDANVYLLKGEELTLVDTGPRKEETFQTLKKELEDRIDLEELERILITHPHSDHFGNAAALKQLTGAEVAVHKDAAHVLRDYGEYVGDQNERFEEYFRKNGVPETENEDLMKLAIPEQRDASVEPDIELEDGDTVGEDELEVLYTPGHTLGAVAFITGEKALVGDTVLEKITPNPMLYLEKDHEPGFNLIDYLGSLEKLLEKDLEKILPGHGKIIGSPESRIREIIGHHEQRKREVKDMVEEKKTAFQVMKEMFPGLPRKKYLFGMSEAVGHLELLASEDELEKIEEDKVYYMTSSE